MFACGEAEEVLNVRRRRNKIDIHAHCASRIVVAALAAVDAASPNYRIVLVDIVVLRTTISPLVRLRRESGTLSRNRKLRTCCFAACGEDVIEQLSIILNILHPLGVDF